jgi:hypothetical protein
MKLGYTVYPYHNSLAYLLFALAPLQKWKQFYVLWTLSINLYLLGPSHDNTPDREHVINKQYNANIHA